jgi:hypothetical protein
LCYNQLRAGCKLVVYFFLFLSLLQLRVWIFASCESHKLQHHFTTLSTRRSRVLASHWVLVQYGLDQHHIEFWSKMVRTRYDEARKHKLILHAKRRRKIVWNSKHRSKSSVCSWREKSLHWVGWLMASHHSVTTQHRTPVGPCLLFYTIFLLFVWSMNLCFFASSYLVRTILDQNSM